MGMLDPVISLFSGKKNPKTKSYSTKSSTQEYRKFSRTIQNESRVMNDARERLERLQKSGQIGWYQVWDNIKRVDPDDKREKGSQKCIVIHVGSRIDGSDSKKPVALTRLIVTELKFKGPYTAEKLS